MQKKHYPGFKLDVAVLALLFLVSLDGSLVGMPVETPKVPRATSPPYASGGFYLEPVFSTNDFGADFDGETFLSDGEEIFIMPRFHGSGLGFGIGLKSERGTLGLYYFRLPQTGTFLAERWTGTYSVIALRFKWQFILRSQLQPYFVCTLNYPQISVLDGAATYYQTGDARFSGFGIDLGAGMTYHLTPKIFISGGAVFRVLFIGWAKGPAGVTKTISDLGLNMWERQLRPTLFTGGLGLEISTGYTF